jgi:hypothetical protein
MPKYQVVCYDALCRGDGGDFAHSSLKGAYKDVLYSLRQNDWHTVRVFVSSEKAALKLAQEGFLADDVIYMLGWQSEMLGRDEEGDWVLEFTRLPKAK